MADAATPLIAAPCARGDWSVTRWADGRWYWEVRLDSNPLGMAIGGTRRSLLGALVTVVRESRRALR